MSFGVPGAHDELTRLRRRDLVERDPERRRERAELARTVDREPQLAVAGVGGELRGRSDRGEAAGGDDRDPVAELLGFVHPVRREQDRRAPLPQIAHELPRGRAGVRVHARGRLVEEQHLRATDERAREREPLRLASREPADVGAHRIAQADEIDERVGIVGVVVVGGEQGEQLAGRRPG